MVTAPSPSHTTALGDFSLTTSGLTANKVFPNLVAGSYSVSENALSAAWEFGGVTCSVANTGTGQTATVALAYGADVTCTFTNRLRPTLTIQKYTTGSAGTFQFSVTGATSLSPSITTSGTPYFGTTPVTPINIGTHTVSETLLAGWTLTDFTCTLGSGTDTNNNGIPDLWTFTAGYGDNVVCTLTNSSGGTTRTQGFWATHTGLANEVWNTAVAGTDAANLCNVGITATTGAGTNQLMGGFWADISQRVENPKKRSDIDSARMQMLQQYLAAVLNVYKFGSGPVSMLDTARAAYCGTDLDLIKAQVGILGTFNTSGDALPFTPGASATAQTSKSQADIKFWDNTTTH